MWPFAPDRHPANVCQLLYSHVEYYGTIFPHNRWPSRVPGQGGEEGLLWVALSDFYAFESPA